MKIFYLTVFTLLCLELASIIFLLVWIYRSTKSWGLAFIAAGYLEWPITNKELSTKLSHGQITLLKITSVLRGVIMILVVVTIALFLAIKIWSH